MFLFGKKEYFKPDADGVSPVIVFVSKAMTVKVFDVPALLGRDRQQTDVMVNDATVSRKHLLIGTYEGKYTATDQGSTVGTVINGERLEPGYPYYLSEGDKIEIGKLSFVCHINKEKAGKKISLPSFMQKDTSADTSEMNKAELNHAIDAANEEAAAEEAEEQIDKDPVIQLMKDAEQEVEAEATAEAEVSEPVINLMPEPELDEAEDDEAEEEQEDYEESPEPDEPEEESAEPEEEPDEPEEESAGSEISEPEAVTAAPAAESEKDSKADPIAELEDMGLDLDGGKPIFVYYSGHTAVETFEITTTPFVIGRATSSDYVPGAAGVSRRHCYIDKTNGIYYITDLESTNGVWINGRKIKPYNRTALEYGDIIGIGDRVYKFEQKR